MNLFGALATGVVLLPHTYRTITGDSNGKGIEQMNKGHGLRRANVARTAIRGLALCAITSSRARANHLTPIDNIWADVKVGKQLQSPEIEDDYLPRVLQAQKDAAGLNINPEAIKALAVADRSLVYYSLDVKNMIGNGGDAPTYDPSTVAQQTIDDAVAATSRQILELGDKPIIGYSVDGARPTGGTPFGVANLSLDSDSTGTEKYVTYNAGRAGAKVHTSKLGSKLNPLNRGAMSIQGADFLADHGWNYLDILHFYFGDDAQLTMSRVPSGMSEDMDRKTLDNFSHDPGMLQSAGQKNHLDKNVLFNASTNAIHSSTGNFDSGSEWINIGYDHSHAKGAPFTFRMLSGTAGDEGAELGNVRLTALGQIGFYLRTTTAGMSTQIAVNDADGLQQSVAKKIIADDKWHKYTWDLGTDANWKSSQHASGAIDTPFTINSIYLHGTSDASVRIDDLFYQQQTYIDPTGGQLGGSSGTVSFVGGNSGTISFGGGVSTPITITTPVAPIPGSGSLQLNNGNPISIGTIGTIHTGSGVASIPNGFDGTLTLNSSGTISTILGSLDDYPVASGTEVTGLANSAVLISDGTFNGGGLLLLAGGSLTLADASVASQYTNVSQPSGIVGSVLVPEPVSLAIIAIGTMTLARRRR